MKERRGGGGSGEKEIIKRLEISKIKLETRGGEKNFIRN